MADVGSLTYTVDAETAPLIRAGDQVVSTTQRMEKSFVKTDKAVSGLNTRMTTMSKSVKAANQGFKLQQNALQQVGFQVQDIAVQLQGGTNALQVFGQQGSQIAGIFGPGGAVLGAVLAVAAALGTAFLPALLNSKKEVDKLEEAMDSLNKVVEVGDDGVARYTQELVKLSKASQEAVKVQITAAILAANDVLKSSREVIRDNIKETTRWLTSLDNLSFFFNELGNDWKALEGILTGAAVGSEFDALKRGFQDFKEEFEFKDTTEAAKAFGALLRVQNDQSTESYQNLLNVFSELGVKYVETNPKLSKFAVGVAQTGLKAREAADSYEKLTAEATMAIDAIGGQEAKDKLVQADTALTQYIERLRIEAETLGMTERARAVYVASLEGATGAQIGELNAIFNKIEAYNEEVSALERKQQAEDAASRQELANQRALAQAKQAQIQGWAQLGGAISQFGAAATGGLGKAFAVFQAFGTAATQISVITAAAQALADPAALNPVQKFANYASIIAAGASIGASIGSVTFSGKQLGGPLQAGQTYRYNEAGAEALSFSDGSRQFLTPLKGGMSIDPNTGGDGGGVNLSVNVINQVASQGIGVRVGNTSQEGKNLTVEMFVADIRSGNGEMSRAVESAYDIQRTTR